MTVAKEAVVEEHHGRRRRHQVDWREAALWLLLLTLLGWLGWHCWVVTERWEADGPPLLAINSFPGTIGAGGMVPAGLEGWTIRSDEGQALIEDDSLVLQKETPSGLLAADRLVPLAAGQRQLRLSMVIETQDIRPGNRSWFRGTVILAGRTGEGRRDQSVPHRLVSLAGTTPATTYSHTFTLAADAADAYLSIRLQRATGVMRVTAITLEPVQERGVFQDLEILTIAAWALFLIAAALRFLQTAPYRGPAMVLVVLLAAGLAFDLLPDTVTSPVVTALDDELGVVGSPAEPMSRLLHLLGFAAVGFLFKLARPRDPLLLRLLLVTLFACGNELLQVAAGDLGLDDVVDAAVNLIGAFIGLGLGAWAYRRTRHRQRVEQMRGSRYAPSRPYDRT